MLSGILALCAAGLGATAGQAAVAITNPVSAVQYPDAIVIRLDGFDLWRRQAPALFLDVYPVGSTAETGVRHTYDLSSSWEHPAVMLQKPAGTTYRGVLVTLRDNGTVLLKQYVAFDPREIAPDPVVPLQPNAYAAIEPGQFMGADTPVIPLPDLTLLATATLAGPAPRTVDATAIARRVVSSVNYPMIGSFNCAALTRQTDDPSNPLKRSVYVALKSQLFDPRTGTPGTVSHYLCEVPLDPAWLDGTNDLAVVLPPDGIRVHATTNTYQGWKPYPILGEGDGGLGQISLAVDAGGNIYYPNVPAELVRFRVATATFEIPPAPMANFLTQCLPASNSIYGPGGPAPWRGRWSPNDARYVVGMTLSDPERMFYLACFQRVVDAGGWTGLYEWAGLFSIPTGSWTDTLEFTNALRFLVGSWTNYPSFYDSLPGSNDNRRVSFVGWPARTHGNTLYLTNYPGAENGHWRVDMGPDGNMTAFGTPATFGPGFSDGYAKPCETRPYNAQGNIDFSNYGRLVMTRRQLYYCLTGTNSTSFTGTVEVAYDAISHMAEHPDQPAFSNILMGVGGLSLAPAYMATAIPGEQGQVLGVGEDSYYLARYDLGTDATADVTKTYLKLDVGNTNIALPLAAGLGPYDHRWCTDGTSNWLHIAGYIGLTRLLYADGDPATRYAMDNFGGTLVTTDLDLGSFGPIKWYRYMVDGLDERLFVTGIGEANRGGTAYSGGLMSYDRWRRDNTLWKLSYLSRCYDTAHLRTRVVRRDDDTCLQEFCLTGDFNAIYAAALPSNTVPVNHDAKLFLYAFETNVMKDIYGFSQAALDGTSEIDDVAYSPDRRHLVILRDNRFLTFDPQARQFIDGRTLCLAGANSAVIPGFNRPGQRLIETPDNRLLCYATSNTVTATNAVFVEIEVSPEGRLSFQPYLALTATNAAPLLETYAAVIAFLPDLTNDDGSHDLLIGAPPSAGKKGAVCRLVEDFVPPRSLAPPRRLSVLANPDAAITVEGGRPGLTPYTAVCTNGETVILDAGSLPSGWSFVRWEDDDGNRLSETTHCAVSMTQDLALVVVVSPPPPCEVASSTHTVGVWSANRTVTVQWSPAGVQEPIEGYAFLFTTNSGAMVPATVMTLGTNATSGELADGTWWFVVRSRDSSGNWGQSAQLGPFLIGIPDALPREDSFEVYAVGASVTGSNGWIGAEGAGLVVGLAYTVKLSPGYPLPKAAHTRGVQVTEPLQNDLPGASNQNVAVDFMLQTDDRVEPTPPALPVQTELCVDTQGVVQVWHLYDQGGTWTQRWTALGNPPLASGQWVRVTVWLDYTNNPDGHTLFRPVLDGVAYPTSHGVAGPTNLTSPGPWYVCANNPGAGRGGAKKISGFRIESAPSCRIDDFVVTPGAPAHTTSCTEFVIR